MRIPLEQQRALYDRFAADAVAELIDVLRARSDEIIERGATRAFATVGIHEYGDSTYWLTHERLDDETVDELADAIFYRQIDVARRAGALPDPD